MTNDAEAQEVHATAADADEPREPVNGYQNEPGKNDQNELNDRPDLADEDNDEDNEVIIAEVSEPDEAEDDTHPDTAPAEVIAAEPVPAEAAGRSGAPESTQMAGDPDQVHQRWAAIQATFVDDPRGSVTSAATLVSEVIDTIVANAKQRENGLRGGWERDGVDTEDLRNTLRSYRALLDQLVAL